MRQHCFLFATLVFFCGSALAQNVFRGSIPGDALDVFGETVGGVGSGIALDARTGHYFTVSDRGAGDGGMDYRPRFLEVEIQPGADGKLSVKILKTILFLDPDGKPMSGLIPDSNNEKHPAMRDGRWCIDPEGVAAASDGTLYVSDEYGPFLYQFDTSGKMLRYLTPPDYYLPKNKNGKIVFGAVNGMALGRVPNRGFEGLTLSPDGKSAWLALQGALEQDGGKKASTSRLLEMNLADGKPLHEYVIDLTKPTSKNDNKGETKALTLSELTYFDEGRFLIIARDNLTERPACKTVQGISIEGADNVLGESVLSKETKTTRGKVVLDLLSLPGLHYLPEKWEGLALSPASDSGGRTLLITIDNDFLTPELHQNGRVIPFPRAVRTEDTLIYRVTLQAW